MSWVNKELEPDFKPFPQLKLSIVIQKLLWQQGLRDVEAIERFLHPTLSDIQDPFAITHVDKAVARLKAALTAGESISILGDYDVDGVTSTTLLVSALRYFGGNVSYYVPRRIEEGYGLSQAAIQRILSEGQPQLFIALDCGTNAVEEIEELQQKGIDVIIIDHHQAKGALSEHAILVNPHVFDDSEEPWFDLCTVGLVFKLVHALVKSLREEGDAKAEQLRLKPYLDLVAMGTIADLVPLAGENRILTRHGLQHLPKSRLSGIQALLKVSGLEPMQPLRSTDISFRLGPRINASGRLADASLSIDMLLANDDERCLQMALELDRFNQERREIEGAIVREAEAIVKEEQASTSGIVLYRDDWHPGVVGIVAGKLSRDFNRPCAVLGREGSLAKGSIRSISGVNLVEILESCSASLVSWGGHPMAAGVSLKIEDIPALTQAFMNEVSRVLKTRVIEPELTITSWIEVNELTRDFFKEIEFLYPFGQKNPEPIWGIEGICLKQPPQRFGDGHFRFQLPTYKGTIQGIAWRQAERIPSHGKSIDVAVRLGWNAWNGRHYPQAELVDWR